MGFKADVHITKEAAAQRQIDAAVRMLFGGEDGLAVHTVAAAAYRIVRDLRKQRGRREIPLEAESMGWFFVAKAFAENKAHTVPKALREHVKKYPQLTKFVAFLGEQASKGRAIELSDFAISTFGIDERAHWSKQGEVANFLKHADLDNRSAISLSKINNEELLMRAISSFVSLAKRPTPEMFVYMLNRSIDVFEDSPDSQGRDAEIVKTLRAIKPEMRGRACLEIISILKRDEQT